MRTMPVVVSDVFLRLPKMPSDPVSALGRFVGSLDLAALVDHVRVGRASTGPPRRRWSRWLGDDVAEQLIGSVQERRGRLDQLTAAEEPHHCERGSGHRPWHRCAAAGWNGASDSGRSSRLCTRPDLVPHLGQAASGACVLAWIRSDRPNNATRSMHTSAPCGNRTAGSSVIDIGHVRDHEPGYRRERSSRDILALIDHTKWVRATLTWPRTFLNRDRNCPEPFDAAWPTWA